MKATDSEASFGDRKRLSGWAQKVLRSMHSTRGA